MTFAEILINTMKDKSEAVNFFDYLFYAKQYCMILESIEGESINSFSPEQLRELEIGFTNVYSPGQLTNLLISFTVSVKGRIAEKAKNSLEVENLLDEMISKNLNTKVKAENPKVIEMFIYFSTQNELEDFIEKYVGIPYVIYKKDKSSDWNEFRSVGYKILAPIILKRPKHAI